MLQSCLRPDIGWSNYLENPGSFFSWFFFLAGFSAEYLEYVYNIQRWFRLVAKPPVVHQPNLVQIKTYLVLVLLILALDRQKISHIEYPIVPITSYLGPRAVHILQMTCLPGQDIPPRASSAIKYDHGWGQESWAFLRLPRDISHAEWTNRCYLFSRRLATEAKRASASPVPKVLRM